MGPELSLDPKLLEEAADWAIVLHYDMPDEPRRQAFEHWLATSPAHAAAWAKAQSVFATFSQVPGRVTRETVQQLQRGAQRRRSIRLLGITLLGLPVAWLALRHFPVEAWSADLRTATGERKTVTLPDGTVLVLNTSSAVNIAFDSGARRIRLIAGEILVTTHADPSPTYRPFLVDTLRGVVHALGTRFIVRQLSTDTYRVAVLEHAVEIRPLSGPSRVLHAGEQVEFGAAGAGTILPVDRSAALWERGMLLARDMRLDEVISELGRYRIGVLRCAPDVSGLRVSGAISLADSDAALQALVSSLPLRIDRHTRYWVTVNGRN